mmetsp:Transcript_5230/g.21550  ORF Transcript_5230/g.21550 Transcript_5230/m.21550 type:complete len:214 (+) Transcript_5230:405-1046(+)
MPYRAHRRATRSSSSRLRDNTTSRSRTSTAGRPRRWRSFCAASSPRCSSPSEAGARTLSCAVTASWGWPVGRSVGREAAAPKQNTIVVFLRLIVYLPSEAALLVLLRSHQIISPRRSGAARCGVGVPSTRRRGRCGMRLLPRAASPGPASRTRPVSPAARPRRRRPACRPPPERTTRAGRAPTRVAHTSATPRRRSAGSRPSASSPPGRAVPA